MPWQALPLMGLIMPSDMDAERVLGFANAIALNTVPKNKRITVDAMINKVRPYGAEWLVVTHVWLEDKEKIV